MSGEYYKGGAEAIKAYLYTYLFPHLSSPNCASKINIQNSFRDFLYSDDIPLRKADEQSDRWNSNLLKRIEDNLDAWEALGVPRPMDRSADQQIYITWRHPKYLDITGRIPLTEEFAQIDEWIKAQSERDFLLVAACYLKLMGANQIYITDASGDGGIDLVGHLKDGPLRSTVYLVQAKTSKDLIDRNAIFTEFGKYFANRNSKIFEEYRRILKLHKSMDGVHYCYIFISNSEFKPNARKVAAELGVLLRSRRQVAYWFAERTNRATLDTIEKKFAGQLNKDLERNIAASIQL